MITTSGLLAELYTKKIIGKKKPKKINVEKKHIPNKRHFCV